MLKYIDVNKIHPHPDNPRKDLGDLTELAESIKTNGIMQNLTVVPMKDGFCVSCLRYNAANGSCGAGYEGRPPCPKWEWREEYTAVIGHRRLAASKIAGLPLVPCIVSDMDLRQQVATMLLENMQRSDLTVYEQAEGFQMMLDLGETIHTISEKTGFSETTVRRRTKLLELDKDKFKDSVGRGATLMDYAKLDEIKDPDLKNEVLDAIGTSNFNWKLQDAIRKEKEKEKRELWIDVLNNFATQIDDIDGKKYVATYYFSHSTTEFEVPEDLVSKKYYYYHLPDHSWVSLYTDKEDTEEQQPTELTWQEKEKIRQAQIAPLKEISNTAFRLRHDFIKGFSNTKAKQHVEDIIKYLVKNSFNDCYTIESDELCKFFEIEDNTEGDYQYEQVEDIVKNKPYLIFLVSTYLTLDSDGFLYFDYSGKYRHDADLDLIYAFLETLGYEMSDEEIALKNGTHHLFIKEE